MTRTFPLVAIVLVLCPFLSLRAEPSALIVTGMAGSETNQQAFDALAKETQRLLIARGFPAGSVKILSSSSGGKVTREKILGQLQAYEKLPASDEFWLILAGHSARQQDNQPAFQVPGPRLTPADLKKALDAIPARQTVLVFTADSGGYIPVLLNKNRTVLAATRAEGEITQPRFPEFWVKALAENPKAPLPAVSARAAELVEAEYDSMQLARAEHARLGDSATGKILEAPFGADKPAKTDPSSAMTGSIPLLSASDIKIDILNPESEWEQHPPTAESKKAIEEARKAPNPEGHAALMLEQRLGYTVDSDRTTDQIVYYRVYLAREEAVARWCNYFLTQSPPSVTTKLELARIIQPDGSSTVFNPGKLPSGSDDSSGMRSSMTMVYLPNAKAGCLVEIGYRTRAMLEPTLPEFSEAISVQQDIPVLKTSLQVRVPKKQNFQVKLYNLKTEPQTAETEDSKVTSWTLGSLPALEQLPLDPPVAEFSVWLGLSSLQSWDDFAAWFKRIARDSDAIDDTVRKKAAELATGAKTREEKIQRAFEFVSAFRYIAIEFGIQGFRPRTPATVLGNRYGDCKDKANLLSALLRSMGIDAWFVLMNRGGWTDTTFPSWQFNHAICYVPHDDAKGQKEDLWLDATDSVTPFGFIAPGNTGRQGLVFFKDKAKFVTVTPPRGTVSVVKQEWDLQEGKDGGWAGTLTCSYTGMADYKHRQQLRGLTPKQVRFTLYQILNDLLPDGEFSNVRLSDLDDLSKPVEIHAQVTSPSRPFPVAGADWVDWLSTPERDRPMVLNDGQPLTYQQVVRYHFAGKAPAAGPATPPATVAGQQLDLKWTTAGAGILERKAELRLNQPIVATQDYTPFRRALRSWSAATEH